MSAGHTEPRRLRIVELIKALDPGGAEALLVSRLSHADHTRFDYRIACLDPSRRQWLPRLLRMGVRQVPLESSSRADWRWVLKLRRYLIDEQIDVVHCHSPLAAPGVRLAAQSLGSSRPVIVTTEHTEQMNRATQLLDVATVRSDDLVIAVSHATSQAPVSKRAKRVTVIHHGVDLTRLRGLGRESSVLQHELEVSSPAVVTVANFRAEKGHDDLLEVAQLVHRTDPDVTFYVAGQGPLEGWVRGQVRARGMDSYFNVLGSISDGARLSAAGDVFALTSRWEGRPVAAMEALATGTPVVASSVGGMSEMITNGVNGYLVPPRNNRKFADRLLRILRHPELAAEMRAAAATTSTRFDIAIACRQIESYYAELAQKRGLRST